MCAGAPRGMERNTDISQTVNSEVFSPCAGKQQRKAPHTRTAIIQITSPTVIPPCTQSSFS